MRFFRFVSRKTSRWRPNNLRAWPFVARQWSTTATSRGGRWPALAFVVPLLVLYEGGLVFMGTQAVRNGADAWLRRALEFCGLGQYFLLPVLTDALLLAWHHVTRERWQLSAAVLYVMMAECAVLGFALLVLGRVEGLVADRVWSSQSGVDPGLPAAMPWVLAGRGALLGRIVGYVGPACTKKFYFACCCCRAWRCWSAGWERNVRGDWLARSW